MKRAVPLVFVLALWMASAAAQTKSAKTLDIYVVDVEGGNAVLFVPPSGQSVLIDTGNGGPGAVRDAERVAAAIRDAGVKQIDHRHRWISRSANSCVVGNDRITNEAAGQCPLSRNLWISWAAQVRRIIECRLEGNRGRLAGRQTEP